MPQPRPAGESLRQRYECPAAAAFYSLSSTVMRFSSAGGLCAQSRACVHVRVQSTLMTASSMRSTSPLLRDLHSCSSETAERPLSRNFRNEALERQPSDPHLFHRLCPLRVLCSPLPLLCVCVRSRHARVLDARKDACCAEPSAHSARSLSLSLALILLLPPPPLVRAALGATPVDLFSSPQQTFHHGC